MKAIGIFLIILGLICLGLGIYGNSVVAQIEAENGLNVDAVLALGEQFGVTGEFSAAERFVLGAVQNRANMMFGGPVIALLGFMMLYRGIKRKA